MFNALKKLLGITAKETASVAPYKLETPAKAAPVKAAKPESAAPAKKPQAKKPQAKKPQSAGKPKAPKV